MGKYLCIKRKLAVPVVLLLIICILGLLIMMIILRLIDELKGIAYIMPDILSRLYLRFIEFTEKLSSTYDWLPSEVIKVLGGAVSNISNSLAGFTEHIIKGVYTTAVSLPQILIFILITILATYFISSDRSMIQTFIKNQLPKKWIKKLAKIKIEMFSMLFGYIKAVLMLMSVTFIELFIGFSFIHIRYALLLAFLVAFIDALPVLGTGSVLIPWALINYINGDFRLGTLLLILYLVIFIVRQMIEPKIIGQQIGLHPLITLAAMYAGLQLAGITGLILGPVTFLLIKSILGDGSWLTRFFESTKNRPL